jgi:hypothetical protein
MRDEFFADVMAAIQGKVAPQHVWKKGLKAKCKAARREFLHEFRLTGHFRQKVSEKPQSSFGVFCWVYDERPPEGDLSF